MAIRIGKLRFSSFFFVLLCFSVFHSFILIEIAASAKITDILPEAQRSNAARSFMGPHPGSTNQSCNRPEKRSNPCSRIH